ncbi:ribitol-5-phosphate dehydrogenase [Levilactobacillus brevis]|uniref:GroES-like protein n=2 Tax=Levilactobacillus brevis TaxID=1580 RepID=U2QYS0_LEVBR|nr:ribitol-5-phosphate dehydrogenase [Levilactobacillus brevis]ERK43882.1 GroES-like protein [Levilactobacillus brevis ATCC 14869 = DSM 20054]KIO99550.1 Xylitol dehydrogenase [Levilactobacillus brevis]KRK20931.1 hypothetical protein FC61_GL000747 [Levilactobacillus brevis ATCC 14869 = DSM 20054]MCT3571439.1 ribitol-5-phosphate dehydrogenase [Levilactobacillus brevis]SQG81453.1 ribitol-5-phosphate 2-dehydrogenase () [Levilactobacillus brevis]
MLNQVYRLVSERKFESFVVSEKIHEKSVVVKPTYLSICHADQRYYSFKRRTEVINEKLPMALIHEGIGKVVATSDDKFSIGDRVIFIPSLPVEKDELIEENYLESTKFRSSNYDGLMQEYIISDISRIVKIPDGLENTIVAFAEMLTVAHQGITRLSRVSDISDSVIGIWGDGNLGYMVSALIKCIYPESKVYVFGHHQAKLNYFSFVDRTFLTDNIPENVRIDQAIEATGGLGSQMAIDQIINSLEPEGASVLMGVSEENVPVNTRMVLQKGLTFVGSSRSSRSDFIEVMNMLTKNPLLVDKMGILVDTVRDIKSIDDIGQAFEHDQAHAFGKTIMHWHL